jgi:hypothetical protein
VIGHKIWAASLLGQAVQKTFKVAEGGDVVEIVISTYADSRGGKDGLPAEEASSAEPEGWAVSVAYKSAPDTFLFSRTFPTEREGQGAFNDLVTAAATVEGLVRQEKFEEAEKATADLMEKFKANSGETPILPTGQA